ncbi:MAG: dihydroorotase, partial [Candidatus Limimorpha sp.]
QVIDAKGKYLLPGAIDDHVHFREPGLTHKADIASESKAAVAGGVTSFMDMPNVNPPTLTHQLLRQKCDIAAEKSFANYSFYIGVSKNNLNEVLMTDPKNVCGIKVFLGSSTGNMLVDDDGLLAQLFKESPCLVAAHCEDDHTIRFNTDLLKNGSLRNSNMMIINPDDVTPSVHPLIRNAEACYKSSSKAVELATKFNGRLHVLHVTSAMELPLFSNNIPVQEKRVTAEACLNHLWFTDKDYPRLGNRIKCNPAVKSEEDRAALRKALIDNRIDVVGTDHAPHALEEKLHPYITAPSGMPSIQHLLCGMLELVHNGVFDITKVVEKLSHNVAALYAIDRRGFVRKGYYADLVIVDPALPHTVSDETVLYKCGWSPYSNVTFHHTVTHTFVNGRLVYHNGEFDSAPNAKPLKFIR